MQFKIRPDRLLVEPIEPTTTESGIFIGQPKNRGVLQGKVIQIGSIVEEDHPYIELGGTVIYKRSSLDQVTIGETTYDSVNPETEIEAYYHV